MSQSKPTSILLPTLKHKAQEGVGQQHPLLLATGQTSTRFPKDLIVSTLEGHDLVVNTKRLGDGNNSFLRSCRWTQKQQPEPTSPK